MMQDSLTAQNVRKYRGDGVGEPAVASVPARPGAKATKAQLVEYLLERGVDADESMTKAQLRELLDEE